MITENEHAAMIAAEKKEQKFWWTFAIVGVILLVGGLSAWMFWPADAFASVGEIPGKVSQWGNLMNIFNIPAGILLGLVAIVLFLLGSGGESKKKDVSNLPLRLVLFTGYHGALTYLLFWWVDTFFYPLQESEEGIAKTMWILLIAWPVLWSIFKSVKYLGPNLLGEILVFGSETWSFNKIKPGFVILPFPEYFGTVWRDTTSKKYFVEIGASKRKGVEKKRFKVPTYKTDTFWEVNIAYACINPEVFFKNDTTDEGDLEHTFVKAVAGAIRKRVRDAKYPDVETLLVAKDDILGAVKEDVQSIFAEMGFQLTAIIGGGIESAGDEVNAAQRRLEAKKITELEDDEDNITLRRNALMHMQQDPKLSYPEAVKMVQVESGKRTAASVDNTGSGQGAIPVINLPTGNP